MKHFRAKRDGLVDTEFALVVLNRTSNNAIVTAQGEKNEKPAKEKMSLEKCICLTTKLIYALEHRFSTFYGHPPLFHDS